MKMQTEKNKGFTLVEMIIVLVVLAILAAIIVPITLGIIDDSREAENKKIAKTIMNAVQTEFNELAANNELWYSISSKMGLPLNKDRKNYGKDTYGTKPGTNTVVKEFKSGFINIGNTVPMDDAFKLIDGFENIYSLYIGAGNVYEYYPSEDKHKMYKVYVVIYQLNDENGDIYFYDGKEVSKEWPFSTPDKNSNTLDGQNFVLKSDSSTKLQIYALKLGKEKVGCDDYWRDVILKKVRE